MENVLKFFDSDFSLGVLLLGISLIGILFTIYQKHSFKMKDYSAALWKALWLRLGIIVVFLFRGLYLIINSI